MTGYVQPQIPLLQELQRSSEELFRQTTPFRVSVRVQTTNDHDIPVLAEVNAPGALSLTGSMSAGEGGQRFKYYDIFKADTVVQMIRDLEMIVQNDTSVDPPAMPKSLEWGGVRAQILTPLVHDGRFAGLLAVHQEEPRTWSDSDIAATRQATVKVQQALDAATWFDL